jgi:hypothetical protein
MLRFIGITELPVTFLRDFTDKLGLGLTAGDTFKEFLILGLVAGDTTGVFY